MIIVFIESTKDENENLSVPTPTEGKGENDPVHQGNIFLFNHFARFETFIPQYLIHEETGAYCRSVAAAEFFDGDERFSQFLYSIGVVPNDLPNLFSFNSPYGACPKCGTAGPGHFDKLPGSWGPRRLPVRISDYTEG